MTIKNINLETRKKIYPIWNIFAKRFPIAATKIKFRLVTGEKLDLKNPRSLNQKMQKLKLYDYNNNAMVTQCCDKYAVREYVKSCGCGEILNELYGQWTLPEQIEWDKLPKKFVLKCNHGSGGNIICKDKEQLDKEKTIQELKTFMAAEYGTTNIELVYDRIPRCVIAEKFIDTADGLPPKDYKIFCSYGEPKLLFVACDRYEGNVKFDFYTPDWEWLPVRNIHPNAGRIEKPPFIAEMMDYARMLSKPFPIVRVDFYYEDNKVIFGELTFLHYGGMSPFDPPEYDEKFGELFPLKN